MKRRKVTRWMALAVCLALAVTVRPVAARIAETVEDARQVQEIEQYVTALGEERLEQYRDLAKWYNHQLELGEKGLRGLYDGILDLGEGRMGVLEVPELHLRLPISHGYTGKVGHDPNSPLPIGGRGNHTVLILTQAYSWGEGQALYIDILGQRLSYRVESVQVMPAGWRVERPGTDRQDLLSLVYDRGNTRTIIRCTRCADLAVRPLEKRKPGKVILAAAWPLVLLLHTFARCRRYAKCEHERRIHGFYREKPEKSNLF